MGGKSKWMIKHRRLSNKQLWGHFHFCAAFDIYNTLQEMFWEVTAFKVNKESMNDNLQL